MRTFLDEHEINVLMSARRRSDGRPADEWASDGWRAVTYPEDFEKGRTS